MALDRTLLALVLVLLAACITARLPGASAQWVDEEAVHVCETKNECLGANTPTEGQFGPTTCLCSDLVPQAYAGGPTNGTCLENQVLGNCDKPWMLEISTADIGPEGYCQITCGRCSCCDSFKEVLTKLGATTLLAAAEAANLTSNLTNPGSHFTLLAPTNAAFAAALTTAGITQEALLADIPKLTELLSYHILPVVPFLETAWTSPFFLPGTVLATAVPGRTIHVGPAAGPAPTLVGGTGGSGTAKVVHPDVEPCKGNVILIDSVLLPTAAAVQAPPASEPRAPAQTPEAVRAATDADSKRLGAEAEAEAKALNAQPAVKEAADAAAAQLEATTGQQAADTNAKLSQQSAAAGK